MGKPIVSALEFNRSSLAVLRTYLNMVIIKYFFVLLIIGCSQNNVKKHKPLKVLDKSKIHEIKIGYVTDTNFRALNGKEKAIFQLVHNLINCSFLE